MHSFSRSPQLVAMMKVPTIWLNILTKKYFTCSPHTYTVYIIHGQNQALDWSDTITDRHRRSGFIHLLKKSQEPFMRGWLGGEDKISNYEKSHRPQIWSHVWYLKTLEWMAHVGFQPCCNSPPNRRPAVFWVFDQSGVEGNVTIW